MSETTTQSAESGAPLVAAIEALKPFGGEACRLGFVAARRIASRLVSEHEDHRLALLRAVVAYDDANQSDLPLTLLDQIRTEVGGPR